MLFVRDYLFDQTIFSANPPTPLVSIILPTYRRRAFLQRALASVLAQTFRDFELIVMDDGSTDGSYDVIKAARARDPRVIHVRHEKNSGLPALRVNEGIELARGTYLAFQFDDDLWHPHALQTLVERAVRAPAPSIIVGRCQIKGETKRVTLPDVAVNAVSLYEQNRFANNSVLLPRDLVNTFGMYDPHIGMRRLCDWDLWLRYIKHIPLIVVDEIISDAFPRNAGSIGLTVTWDLALFRYWHDIPRDHLLKPAHWHDYPVDALRVGEIEIEKDFRRRLYEEHIVPYYLSARHLFPQVEGFSAMLPPRSRTALVTKHAYDVSNDVALNHYDTLAHARGNFKTYFQPLRQVADDWTRDADALLLVRTIEDEATLLLQNALAENIAAGVYLDDDLLTFHEYGSEFAYLAPGAPAHRNLTDLLKQTDAVWATNRFIAESVRAYTPRIVPHNGCVPADAVPREIRPRDPLRPLRIGYVGSGYRIEEFTYLWRALERVAADYRDKLTFEFWGLDTTALPALASPVMHKPFTFSYYFYLRELRDAGFDILLTPLLDAPRPRLGKAPSKYYQTALAGAFGIFSDVPQYASLPAGLTCLKARNTVEDWERALRDAIEMPREQFDAMRRRMVEHVRQEFTEHAQIHLHEAAWRATEFHARTRAARHTDGRPRVMYVLHSAHFGGGEIQLWRRLHLAREYGIEPIVVLPHLLQISESAQRIVESLQRDQIQVEFADYTCFTEPRSPNEFRSDGECADVRALIQRCAPAIVHTVTFIPTFGQVCGELNVPHVASLYAVDDQFAWVGGWADFKHCEIAQSDSIRYAKRWGDLLAVEKFCSRELVPNAIFALGRARYLENLGAPKSNALKTARLVITGTFQERKQQLETIEAIGQLARAGWDCQLDIYGYTHFFPEYVEKCRARVHALGLDERVQFCGFSENIVKILGDADIVCSLSTYESFPSAIKEAMAGGALVVATPVGGIPELIVDGVSGILCADTSVEAITNGIRRALSLSSIERERIVEQARRVARSEFHPYRVANDLMLMYNRAIESTRARPSLAPTPSIQSAPAPRRSRMLAPPLPPMSVVPLDRQLICQVVPHHSSWIGLDVLAGTYQRQANGTIVLRVYAPAGRCVRECSVDLARAHDNDWLRFRFEPMLDFANREVILKFVLLNASPRTRLGLYDAHPAPNKLRRIWQRVARWIGLGKPMDSLYCRMWYAQ
jgi:glycosyltransferase involved in cell wall biosynthesis